MCVCVRKITKASYIKLSENVFGQTSLENAIMASVNKNLIKIKKKSY